MYIAYRVSKSPLHRGKILCQGQRSDTLNWETLEMFPETDHISAGAFLIGKARTESKRQRNRIIPIYNLAGQAAFGYLNGESYWYADSAFTMKEM